MTWIEAKVVFESPDSRLAVELISEAFYELGVNGVVVEDPHTEPGADWAAGAEKRPEGFAVIGYIAQDRRAKAQCGALESALRRLAGRIPLRYTVAYGLTAEADWAEAWKRFFKPRRVGRRLVVKPSWHPYDTGVDEIVLEIDPGMAFGTGTHPTTGMCLEMIETHVKPGTTFLDVGVGSGILMIAAGKLGARRMVGIDADPMAVEIAHKNLILNRIPEDFFSVKTGHLVQGLGERFQVVACNILSGVLLSLLEDLASVLTDDGTFIFSGIAEDNKDTVIEKIRTLPYTILHTCTREQWVGLAGRPVGR